VPENEKEYMHLPELRKFRVLQFGVLDEPAEEQAIRDQPLQGLDEERGESQPGSGPALLALASEKLGKGFIASHSLLHHSPHHGDSIQESEIGGAENDGNAFEDGRNTTLGTHGLGCLLKRL